MRCLRAVVALLAVTAPARAQDTRAVAVVVPDTIRIGEPFTLGIAVRSPSDTAASFPSLLVIEEGIEQLSGAEIRPYRDDPREWRAYYRLTAWTVDSVRLPDVTVDIRGPAGSRALVVSAPYLNVMSVLPPDTVPVWLEPPRPPVSLRNWLWLLLVLLAALAAAYLIRRWLAGRATAPEEEPEFDAASRALAALNELAEAFERGEIEGPPFFDRLEVVLRVYLETTRSLRPGTSMRLLSSEEPTSDTEPPPPSEVLELSGLIRFARLHAQGAPEVAAVRDCSAWIERDRTTIDAARTGEEES